MTSAEKCSNYTVLSTVIMNTLLSMKRFQHIPKDVLISKVYRQLKAKAKTKAE